MGQPDPDYSALKRPELEPLAAEGDLAAQGEIDRRAAKKADRKKARQPAEKWNWDRGSCPDCGSPSPFDGHKTVCPAYTPPNSPKVADIEEHRQRRGTPPPDPDPDEADLDEADLDEAALLLANERLHELARPVEFDGDPIPAVITRDDGHPLIPDGRVSFLVGDPGGGKSWIAATFAAIHLANGGRVLWIDNEDSPAAFAERMMLLGAYKDASNPDKLLFVDMELLEDPIGLNGAQEWLRYHDKPLVVIDTAQATGADSTGGDINEWWKNVVRPWQKIGATVIVIDHRPKRPQDRAPGPIGSVHKMSRLDGVCLAVNGNPWTRDQGGTLSLKIEKDRARIVGKRNSYAADIAGRYDSHGAFLITIADHTEPPADHANPPEMADRIRGWFADNPDPISQNKLREQLGVSRDALRQIVGGMVGSGQLTKDPKGRLCHPPPQPDPT